MLSPSARVGPYEIVSSLGAGGMGEVYRARDRRLNRDVAVKILPDAFAADGDRVARFTREAQTLAALNHPHIAQIYGIEESDGGQALVMELVEGETLADRLARGAVPVDEAIPIARQVAEALEAAHDAGIVHRDLKPANIRLRPDGSVKVLDFGLAKAIEPAATPERATALNSPTFTSPAMTQAGIILGTASYMSPEQAKGKAVDRRADIWAFGCVLFEMLTGRTLYAADTVGETLARVIERAPDLSALPATTPPAVRALIARTLERDPKQRLRDIGEARITLADPFDAVAPTADSTPGKRRSTIVLLMLAAAALAATATAWILRASDTTTPPAERRLALTTPNGLPPLAASISPDGSTILTVAGNKLWVQKLDSFDAAEVPGSEGARGPFWSADGTSFGFQARGQLWRIPRDGGAAVSIGRVPDSSSSGGVAWLRDGRLIYTSGGTGLLQIPARGGDATPLFTLDPAKELDVHSLTVLPDGQTLLYVLHPVSGHWTIETFNLADASRRTVYTPSEDPVVNQPVYSRTGHVLFEQRTGIWALPFSLRDRQPAGAPFLTVANARQPSIAADGTLVMTSGAVLGVEAGLAWMDRSSRVVRTVVQPRGELTNPRLSPDGRLAVATRGARNAADLWIVDLERGSERRLTFEAGPDTNGTWSPDGQFIVYECGRAICSRRADGVGTRVELLDAPAAAPALSRDGRLLAFTRQVSPGDTDIFVVSIGGLSAKVAAAPRVLISAPRLQGMPEISPDGAYIAYASSENGMHTVFVAQFPDGQGKWQVPVAGITAFPRWSAKGDRLYVRDEMEDILELPVDRTRLFEIGAATARVSGSAAGMNGYDRSADGTQFLVPIAPDGGPAGKLLVVQNWRPDSR
jgi:eukaryotic-like serine/threonine-protein kinase